MRLFCKADLLRLARRDAAVQAAAQEVLAQFPATVLRAALRGDQWRDVLDAALSADRDVEIDASAAEHSEEGQKRRLSRQLTASTPLIELHGVAASM